MIAYKLLDQELRSNNGRFQWEIGKEYTIDKPGNEMCSDEVFHCYNHPALAVLFNPLHGFIDNPRLFEIEVPEFVNDDKLKFASKSQKLIKELDLPIISKEQRVEFAIKIAKLVCKDEVWNAWADKWLSGEDRSANVANIAYNYACVKWAGEAAVDAARAVVNTDPSAWSANSAWSAHSAAYAGVTNEEFTQIIEEIMNR